MSMHKKILFGLGVILLLINIIGLFKTMRNPELYTLEKTIKNRLNDVTIPYPEIKDQLERKRMNLTEILPYALIKLSMMVLHITGKRRNREVSHAGAGMGKLYFVCSFLYQTLKSYERYEFADYKKNLEREWDCVLLTQQ